MLNERDRQLAHALLTGAPASSAGDDEQSRLLHAYLAEKADLGPTRPQAHVTSPVEIIRDARGVPHICAENPRDLFFGLGYAQAQDRLWQLDYLRRQAHGRLAEVFGPAQLSGDILSRTLGVTSMANRLLGTIAPESRAALEAFVAGVNAWVEHQPAGLPPEFDIHQIGFEPWSAVDSLAIQRRWWWYLTGRLGVLTTPEAVRAGVGDGDLFDAFFSPDAPIAYIVPEGHYDPTPAWPQRDMDAGGTDLGWPPEAVGSNNWTAAPSITEDGKALLASDPHIYFTVPVDWYEAHLHGAGYDCYGSMYPAMPGIIFGRNPKLAWGVTNNICSLRDLYVEEWHPSDPNLVRSRDGWSQVTEVTEEIAVRGAASYQHTTRFAHGRPIVDHLVPDDALPSHLFGRPGTSLSLAWVGFEAGDEIQSLLDLNRASVAEAGAQALRGWRCPTFNFVFADDAGDIAYQCSGALPLRGRPRRGYRDPLNADDDWQGVIPFDGLPRMRSPQRGWISSANNPTAPANFPYPLSGTWAPEDRAPRAEHLMQTMQPHSLETFMKMQTDVHSGRAERATPGLLKRVAALPGTKADRARSLLADWDFHLTPESPAGAIFYVFFWKWHVRVVSERFSGSLVPLVQDAGWGLSSDLVHGNLHGWFADDATHQQAIETAFTEALEWLSERFGPDPGNWRWGAIHTLGATHVAASTDLQHDILSLPQQPHAGGSSTLASAFYTPLGSFQTRLGASYRLIAKLDDSRTTLAITWPGQSGQPGSPHYQDQVEAFLAGEFKTVPFRWEDVETSGTHRIQIEPAV